MTRCQSRWIAALTLLISALSLSVPAQAQDRTGNPLASRCIMEIRQVTARAVNVINEAGMHGVMAIRRLDLAGASDDELNAAATRATNAIRMAAERGRTTVTSLAHRCIETLTAANAPVSVREEVRRAAANAVEVINRAAHAAAGHVAAALERALNNDSTGDSR